MVALARALLLIAVLAGVAAADGPGQLPLDEVHAFAGDGLFRPPIEWSTWVRIAYGVEQRAPAVIARATTPLDGDRAGAGEAGLGIEASLSLSRHGNVRLGGWLEQRGFSRDATFAGGELVLTRVPRTMNLFLYEGHGLLALRAGRSADANTASIAYGYVAPYWLEGPCRQRFYGIDTGVCSPRPQRTARYMAGVRLVATATRDRIDRDVWSATLGIELEPIGALRMMTAARSWY